MGSEGHQPARSRPAIPLPGHGHVGAQPQVHAGVREDLARRSKSATACGTNSLGHNIALLTKLKDREIRLWYATQAIENDWSRKILEAQIATDLRGREGSALTTFAHALPAPDSELVRDAIKDPYNFEFLGLSNKAKERDLEQALLNDIQSFLMEMGRGFALAGRQFPLKIIDEETGREEEFFIDLLFYNYILRRLVVIDLKVQNFKPEYAGKMSFYLTAVDELERQPGDEPTIGLILCKSANETVVEYALRDVGTPIQVSEYRTQPLPEPLRQELPTTAEIEAVLRALPMPN